MGKVKILESAGKEQMDELHDDPADEPTEARSNGLILLDGGNTWKRHNGHD